MLYAVIGYPVNKTLSPAMHNAAFKYYRIDSQYLRMPVKQRDLGSVIRNLARFGFRGANITVPYKEQTMKYLDSISKTAIKIKAVNTIVITKNRLHGENTDINGFYQSTLIHRIAIKGKTVMLIGAGGAGRAVASVLERLRPAVFLLTDLSDSRVRKASELFDAELISYNRLRIFENKCDVVINATPCDHQNVAETLLKRKGIYYDLNYLYKRRLKRNKRYVNGLEMLVRQGARSFEIWTGRKAPFSVMRKAVRQHA